MSDGGRRGDLWIASAGNPLVRRVVRLRRSAHRAHDDRMLIEGGREVALALSVGMGFEVLLYTREALKNAADNLCLAEADRRGIECIACDATVFAKMALRASTERLLALAIPQRRRLSDLSLPRNALLLVVESVEKPGNLGAMLRSADAAAADAVLVCDGRTDTCNPNVVRASLGALFTLPVVECGGDEAREFLRRLGIAIVVATPEAPQLYTDCDLIRATALVVGAEDRGLSAFWRDVADLQVRIPMLGRVDSLNVSTAATLLLYEAVRQRGVVDARKTVKRVE